jgi:hypothetical protein
MMKYYALRETDSTRWDYNLTYVREWAGDAESLREHLRNMSDGIDSMDTVEIRPATEEEIAFYQSADYED